MLHRYHRPTLSAIKHLFREGRSNFGLFILCWFVVMFGTWMIYNLYPLIMNHVYHINAGLSSLYYAIGAGLGIVFYAWSTLIVAATALTGGLATIPEGEAMGIFNATKALASVLSALAAGFLADHFGYALVVLLAAAIYAGGLVIGLPILRFKD